MTMPDFNTQRIYKDTAYPRTSHLLLNQSERLKAMNHAMPREIRASRDCAAAEKVVHVTLVEGAGKGFCGGYGLNQLGESNIGQPCQREQFLWDPKVNYTYKKRSAEDMWLSRFSR